MVGDVQPWLAGFFIILHRYTSFVGQYIQTWTTMKQTGFVPKLSALPI